MALSVDSLVTDLMFQANAAIDQQKLIEGLGGQDVLEAKQLLDVDRLDPRAEMELSPSMPFRHRGERRLMIIDDTVITPRKDPQAETKVMADLRPAKEAPTTAPSRQASRSWAVGSGQRPTAIGSATTSWCCASATGPTGSVTMSSRCATARLPCRCPRCSPSVRRSVGGLSGDRTAQVALRQSLSRASTQSYSRPIESSRSIFMVPGRTSHV